MLYKVISYNVYSYGQLNPIINIDPSGLDGISVNYDYYPVNTGMGFNAPLGHGSVVAVNPTTGVTMYYEYGRYDAEKYGEVKTRTIPNIEFNENGDPTEESLEKLYDYMSKHYGKNCHVSATYYKDADYDKIINYCNKLKNKKNRKKYNLLFNNCKDFRDDAIDAGRK